MNSKSSPGTKISFFPSLPGILQASELVLLGFTVGHAVADPLVWPRHAGTTSRNAITVAIIGTILSMRDWLDARPMLLPTIFPPLSRPPAHPHLPRHAPLLPHESSSHSPSSAVVPVAQFAPVRPAAASDIPAEHRAETHTAPNVSNAAHESSSPCPAPTESALAKNKSHCPRNPKPS